MVRVVDILMRARDLGFLGPGPVETHVEHALGFAVALGGAPARLVDLGSGGGVPGLVLAAHWPDTEVVLLDANERRTGFVREAIAELGWGDRVSVVRMRAEDAGRDPRFRAEFPAVVARGFGSPPVTAECAAPLLHVGGVLVVSEPPEEDTRWAPTGLVQLGMALGPVVLPGARYQVLHQVTDCPERYPRRVGIPVKRPLW